MLKRTGARTLAVGRSSVIVIYFFSLRVLQRNDGSPEECESCTSGSSPLSCCRHSQAVSGDFPCFKAIFEVLVRFNTLEVGLLLT